MRPAAFLDRDGTIIVERDYLGDPAGVVLEQGASAALRLLLGAGFQLIVVSNQSGVARGKLTLEQVRQVNARLADLLSVEGVSIAGWYICPHGPDEGCNCRKPKPGMIDRATADHGVDLRRSAIIGDKDSDVLAGLARGIGGHLVLTGHGAAHADWARQAGYPVHRDLLTAARAVVAARNEAAP